MAAHSYGVQLTTFYAKSPFGRVKLLVSLSNYLMTIIRNGGQMMWSTMRTV